MNFKTRPLSLFSLALIASQMLSTVAFATPPLRDPKKLWEPRTETVLQLSNARIIMADYKLIRQDFPEVAKYSDRQIDEWLVKNTGYMSIQQVAQQDVNYKIPVTGKATTAYRPREYGRAHVFKAGNGLIDVKGSGGIDPHMGFERTGLATLGEVIREFLMEKLVSRVFQDIGKYETVPCYAVMDPGFTTRMQGSRAHDVPAGMILRRAHTRHHVGVIGEREREDPVVLPNETQLEIELALRKYGITSTIDLYPGRYKNKLAGDQLNIQGDNNGAVVDFAGFRIKSHFERPIYYTYDSSGNAVVSERDVAVWPKDSRFVQPQSSIRIPLKLWGTESGQENDNPFLWSEELAESLGRGEAQPKDALTHWHNMMDPVDYLLRRSAHAAKPLRCEAIFGS